jgi:hypothetical protein
MWYTFPVPELNEIPFHDPIKDVELLVAWMTRAKGYTLLQVKMKIDLVVSKSIART